ncbi:hypothetical protein B0H14DRAFT_2654193 [Mycena olivaceomarginata]|nr:hypothetical protein B0H14DRAFT_2654193 [Mycena olivaceomarginata]
MDGWSRRQRGRRLNAVRVVGDVNGHGGGVDEHGGRWARCEQWAVVNERGGTDECGAAVLKGGGVDERDGSIEGGREEGGRRAGGGGILGINSEEVTMSRRRGHRRCLTSPWILARLWRKKGSAGGVGRARFPRSKSEAGSMAVEAMELYSLRQTVFDILKSLVGQATYKGLDLTLDVAPEIPDVLTGDSLHIRQVITNLVGDAIKFTELDMSRSTLTLFLSIPTTSWRNGNGALQASNLAHAGRHGERARQRQRVIFHHQVANQSKQSLHETLLKLSPVTKQTILLVDTMHDDTGIEECLSELGLVPVVVDISEVSDKEKCPHIDTIIVDSLSITECLREHEHLRYIPVALLEPVLPPLNENSISAYNTTPITAFDLYHVLLPSALGTNTVNPASAAAEVTYDILLAEDNLVYQRLVLKMLEKYGHSIELAENGSLALQAFMERVLHQKPFHVIIMDVWMPLMGGIEATQRIREYEAQYHLASTPIIALMAHGLSGDRERCLQAGMDDIIPRPMRRDDLVNAISRLTQRQGASQDLFQRLHTRIIPKPHSLYHLVSPTVPDTADLLYRPLVGRSGTWDELNTSVAASWLSLSPLSLSIKISWEGILVCLAPRHFAQLHEDPNSGEEVTITVLGSAQGFNYIMPRLYVSPS